MTKSSRGILGDFKDSVTKRLEKKEEPQNDNHIDPEEAEMRPGESYDEYQRRIPLSKQPVLGPIKTNYLGKRLP